MYRERGKQMRKSYELIDTVMALWAKTHNDYQNLLSRYEYLLIEKRSLGLRPIHAIRQSVLEEWPIIPLLNMSSEEEVEDCLVEMTRQELEELIIDITTFRHSYVYHTIKARITDFKYEIRRFYCPKTALSVDPDCRHSSYCGPVRYGLSDD